MYEHFRTELAAAIGGLVDGEKLQQLMAAVDRVSAMYEITGKGGGAADQVGGLPSMVQAYLMARSTEGLSSATIRGYRYKLGRFFREIGKEPEHVTANDVRVWLHDRQGSGTIGNESLNGYRVSLNSFFNWAVAEEYMVKNPVSRIKNIRYEKKQRHALGQMELEYIRRACVTAKERALVEFLYSTGCRVSEVVGTKLSDVDWIKKEVDVLGKGNKHRTVYLNAKAYIAIKAYLDTREDDGDGLFVTDRAPHHAIGKAGLEKIIRVLCGRCGALGVHVTPHVLRHTTATVAIQNGMPVQDVQRMLGHANISTTMIYAEINQAEVKAEHGRCVI